MLLLTADNRQAGKKPLPGTTPCSTHGAAETTTRSARSAAPGSRRVRRSPFWTARHYTNPRDRHNLHAVRHANHAMFLLLFGTARAKW